ncbi:MAG: hypothetical protein M0Z53_03230 [Thermaerobacter sp.]|nr:hypothetical protein [Thermaerobacter sp.]
MLEMIPLTRTLERDRGRGRNDYPVRAMWNSVPAGVVWQHPGIERVRRERGRNGQLREMVGLSGSGLSASAHKRFLRRGLEHREDLETIIHAVIDGLQQVLPDFGERLAIDSQAIGLLSHIVPTSRRRRASGYGCGLGQADLPGRRCPGPGGQEGHRLVWL